MPTVDELFPSKYLKAANLGGKTVRLQVAFLEPGVKLGADTVNVLHFGGTEQMLVLNKTNYNRIVMALYPVLGDKAKNSDNWTGQAIDLYEEMVEFQGALKPAIRVRVPGQTAPQQPPQGKPAVTGHMNAPPPASPDVYGAGSLAEDLDDSIPFAPEWR